MRPAEPVEPAPAITKPAPTLATPSPRRTSASMRAGIITGAVLILLSVGLLGYGLGLFTAGWR